MTLAFIFWFLILLALLLGGLGAFKKADSRFLAWSGPALIWVLVVILGYAAFGSPIK